MSRVFHWWLVRKSSAISMLDHVRCRNSCCNLLRFFGKLFLQRVLKLLERRQGARQPCEPCIAAWQALSSRKSHLHTDTGKRKCGWNEARKKL